jgi:hypothetical protein
MAAKMGNGVRGNNLKMAASGVSVAAASAK